MSSKSSSESISKDINVLVNSHNKLNNQHHKFTEQVANALKAVSGLDDIREKQIKSLNKRVSWLSLALIVQAVYLIIFL